MNFSLPLLLPPLYLQLHSSYGHTMSACDTIGRIQTQVYAHRFMFKCTIFRCCLYPYIVCLLMSVRVCECVCVSCELVVMSEYTLLIFLFLMTKTEFKCFERKKQKRNTTYVFLFLFYSSFLAFVFPSSGRWLS